MNKHIDGYLEWITLKNYSDETIRGYRQTLTKMNDFLEVCYNGPVYVYEINLSDLETFLAGCIKSGQKAVSVNRGIYILRSFYKYLVRRGVCSCNIADFLDVLKFNQEERVSLTRGEIRTLIRAIDHDLVKVVVETLANTGLRIAELTNLRVEDVDLDKDIIHVINGKGGKNREIPINQRLKPILEKYAVSRPKVNRFFATERSGKISMQYVNKVLKDASNKLKWKKSISCHILRHSFASNLVRKGVEAPVIQRLLGHADLRITGRYIHRNLDDLKIAINQL